MCEVGKMKGNYDFCSLTKKNSILKKRGQAVEEGAGGEAKVGGRDIFSPLHLLPPPPYTKMSKDRPCIAPSNHEKIPI